LSQTDNAAVAINNSETFASVSGNQQPAIIGSEINGSKCIGVSAV